MVCPIQNHNPAKLSITKTDNIFVFCRCTSGNIILTVEYKIYTICNFILEFVNIVKMLFHNDIYKLEKVAHGVNSYISINKSIPSQKSRHYGYTETSIDEYELMK